MVYLARKLYWAFLDLIPDSFLFCQAFFNLKETFPSFFPSFNKNFTSPVANDSESGRNSPQYNNGISQELVNGKVSSLLARTMENIQLTKQ